MVHAERLLAPITPCGAAAPPTGCPRNPPACGRSGRRSRGRTLLWSAQSCARLRRSRASTASSETASRLRRAREASRFARASRSSAGPPGRRARQRGGVERRMHHHAQGERDDLGEILAEPTEHGAQVFVRVVGRVLWPEQLLRCPARVRASRRRTGRLYCRTADRGSPRRSRRLVRSPSSSRYARVRGRRRTRSGGLRRRKSFWGGSCAPV